VRASTSCASRSRLHDRTVIDRDLVLTRDCLAAEPTAHRDLLGQVVVRACEQHKLLPARELAVGVGEHVVQALTEIDLEIREHRSLERAGELERARDRELVALDAQVRAAADLGEPLEHSPALTSSHRTRAS